MRSINSWATPNSCGEAAIHEAKLQLVLCHKVMVLDGQLTDAVKEIDDSLLGGNHDTHEVHFGAELDLKELVAVIGEALYHGAVHIIYLKGLMTALLCCERMNEALVHITVDEGIHYLVSRENTDHLAGLDGAHHLLALLLKRANANIVFVTGLGLVRFGSGRLLLFLLCGGNGDHSFLLGAPKGAL